MDLATADRRTLELALRSPLLGEAAKERVRARLGELGQPEAATGGPGRVLRHAEGDGGKSTATAVARPTPIAGAGSLRLTLWGPPRTKKTHNQLRRHGGRLKVIPSAAWMAWRDALLATGQLPAGDTLPDLHYNCAATFFRDREAGDLVGFQQGLADVLEEGGVVSDDKWIRGWDGSRLDLDRACPRVEITLTPLTR